jgi:streptogramin lyase
MYLLAWVGRAQHQHGQLEMHAARSLLVGVCSSALPQPAMAAAPASYAVALLGHVAQLAASFAMLAYHVVQAGSSDIDHFVQVDGGRFVVNCNRFYASGWNM